MEHSKSPQAIGTDSVLLGSWTKGIDNGQILDIGTGCGLLALMLAQKSEKERITGIDISEVAIEEAKTNGLNSPWAEDLDFIHSSLEEYNPTTTFDLIISNPPYFEKQGLQSPDEARALARHNSKMPLHQILSFSSQYLKSSGELSLVLPYSNLDSLRNEAKNHGLNIQKILLIRPNARKEINRMLVSLSAQLKQEQTSELVVRDFENNYTLAYKELTFEYYL